MSALEMHLKGMESEGETFASLGYYAVQVGTCFTDFWDRLSFQCIVGVVAGGGGGGGGGGGKKGVEHL